MEWLKSIDIDAKTLALLKAGKEEESRFFKLRVHERLEDLEKQTAEWAELRLAHIHGGDEVRKVKEGRYAMLTFAFWPGVRDPQRAITLFKLSYWLFLFDDVVDESGGLRRQSHQVAFTQLSELMDSNKPPSVKEYMLLRGVSAAVPLCIALSEYELAIDLDTQTLNHPLVKQLHQVIVNQCLGLNDFFSFPKELLKGDYVNLLPLLHIQNNTLAQQAGQPFVPFHVAVSQAWEMINAQERECARLSSLVLKSPLLVASNPSLKEYVEAKSSVLMPKLPFKNLPSSMMTFRGFLLSYLP